MLRSGAIVAAFYYTKKTGIWGSPEETEQLYNSIKQTMQPHAENLERKLPFEVPPLPQTGELRYLVKHYYNNGVKSSFHFVDMLPCYTGQLANKIKVSIQELAKTSTKSE